MDYVTAVFAKEVRVQCSSPDLLKKLMALGAVSAANTLSIHFSSQQGLAVALTQLQQLGIAFGDEPTGWPPAAIFMQLRNQGLVAGSIKTVSWYGPNEPFFREA